MPLGRALARGYIVGVSDSYCTIVYEVRVGHQPREKMGGEGTFGRMVAPSLASSYPMALARRLWISGLLWSVARALPVALTPGGLCSSDNDCLAGETCAQPEAPARQRAQQ